MKKVAIIIFFTCALSLNQKAEALFVSDYFSDFYAKYLNQRNISEIDREIPDELFLLSKNKISALEIFLECAQNKNERDEAINLINEEFFDLIENLNFELCLSGNSPLTSKQKKKIKKSHKNFIKKLEKQYKNSFCNN